MYNHLHKTYTESKIPHWKEANEFIMLKMKVLLHERTKVASKVQNITQDTMIHERQKRILKQAKLDEEVRVNELIHMHAHEQAVKEVKELELKRLADERLDIIKKTWEGEAIRWKLVYRAAGLFVVSMVLVISLYATAIPATVGVAFVSSSIVLIFLIVGIILYRAYNVAIILPIEVTQDELDKKIEEIADEIRKEKYHERKLKEEEFKRRQEVDKQYRREYRAKKKEKEEAERKIVEERQLLEMQMAMEIIEAKAKAIAALEKAQNPTNDLAKPEVSDDANESPTTIIDEKPAAYRDLCVLDRGGSDLGTHNSTRLRILNVCLDKLKFSQGVDTVRLKIQLTNPQGASYGTSDSTVSYYSDENDINKINGKVTFSIAPPKMAINRNDYVNINDNNTGNNINRINNDNSSNKNNNNNYKEIKDKNSNLEMVPQTAENADIIKNVNDVSVTTNVSRKSSVTAEVPEQITTPSSDDAKLSPEAIRDLLVKYYTKFDTEKLKSIDKLMDKYKGKESELIDALEKKYGKLPLDTVDNGSNVNAAPTVSSRASSPVNVSRKASVTAEVPEQTFSTGHEINILNIKPSFDLEQGNDADVIAISLIEMEEEEKYHIIEICDHQLLTVTLYTDSSEAGQITNSVSDKFDASKQFASFSVTFESITKQDVDDLGCFIIDSYIHIDKDKLDADRSKDIESIGKVVLTMQNIV